MKRKVFIISLLVCIGAISGCKDFLDVRPDNQVFEKDLFIDRSGFETALAGVYTTLLSSQLYGKELKYGFMDVLAGYYTISATHTYEPVSRYDYALAATKANIARFWGRLFNSVNQVNIILKNIENIQSDPYQPLIKGEALGLRAYIHFQLLKLFGPVISQEGLGAKAIPYYTAVSDVPQPFLNAGEVLQAIEQDLQDALALLQDDPIKENGRVLNANATGVLNYNSLIDFRGARMNYYAVKGLLAQKSQWEGDQKEAYERALALVNDLDVATDVGIHLIQSTEIVSATTRLLRFSPENLFSLYGYNLFSVTDSVMFNTSVSSTRQFLPAYTYLRDNLYANSTHGSTNDYRLLYWFTSTQNVWRLEKLRVPENIDPSFTDSREVKMVSLADMYYIIAESLASTDPAKALEYLNKLRTSRNLSSALIYSAQMTTEDVMDFIIAEQRKDLIGEGQLFFLYKRLFRNVIKQTGEVNASLTIFKLPIPDDEQIYNLN